MKAGSLPDDDAVALRECRASPSSGEVCLEVCSRYVSLCLHLFFSITNFSQARVAEQQRHLTVNQAFQHELRRCESYRVHQIFLGM